MNRRLSAILVLVVTLVSSSLPSIAARQPSIPSNNSASIITIDFEDLTNYTVVTTQYSNLGVAFEGAQVLSEGGNLNYLHFPPRSGLNVIYDDPQHWNPGNITITFDTDVTGSVLRVGGYVTGNRNVSMTTYDADGNTLGSVETGGLNHAPQGTPNMLLEINASAPIARVTFFNGGERGNTYTIDDFFFEGEQTCTVGFVPLFKQSDTRWGDEYYGGTTEQCFIDPSRGGCALIKNWGCALTSAAMVVSYYGSRQTGFTTTPLELNGWLKANKGYTGGHISWYKVAEYARKHGVQLHHRANRGPDDGVVNWSLCNSSPIVLYTQSPPYHAWGHFVVATAQADSSHWKINDPGGADLEHLAASSYTGYRRFSSTATDPSSLSIAVHSPVELLVTDPAGRRTGYDPTTGRYLREILDSSYGIETIGASYDSHSYIQALFFTTSAPLSGDYHIELVGTGSGWYTVDFLAYESTGTASHATVKGGIVDDATIELRLAYSDDPGAEIEVEQLTFLPSVHLPLVVKHGR